MNPLVDSYIPGMQPRRGKVRHMYDFGDRLLMVATDQISAFDWVLPTLIPDKGRVLTQMSAMWFGTLNTPNHMISMHVEDLPLPTGTNIEALRGRSMVVCKLNPFPVECVVRNDLSGSGWKEYKEFGTVCGIKLPDGLIESQEIPGGPIFTPATKEKTAHDINISFERMCEIVGKRTAEELRRRSLSIFVHGNEYARRKGIRIADTKFEFGTDQDGNIFLIDEVLTPDSSRFWPEDCYRPGGPQISFDKQFVRDWLENEAKWDKNSPPPELPPMIVLKTREKYIEAYERLSTLQFPWA